MFNLYLQGRRFFMLKKILQTSESESFIARGVSVLYYTEDITQRILLQKGYGKVYNLSRGYGLPDAIQFFS